MNTKEEEYIQLVIYQNTGVLVQPTKSYYLLDTAGNETLVCVEFIHTDNTYGYGIIDLVDFVVTMFALDADVPFEETDEIIYGGPLAYAIVNEDGESATILGADTVVPLSAIYDGTRVGVALKSQDEKDTIINSLRQEQIQSIEPRATEPSPVLIAGGDDDDLVYSAGNNDGSWATDCGINAVAMYLRHMDEYFNNTYVHSMHPTEEALKVALAALATQKWNATTSLSMSRQAELINSYTAMYGTSGEETVSNFTYTWSSYKYQISNGNGKPCILYIGASDTQYWSSAHVVLGVGYTYGATATSGYIIANSGWVSLGYVNILTTVPGSVIR